MQKMLDIAHRISDFISSALLNFSASALFSSQSLFNQVFFVSDAWIKRMALDWVAIPF